STGESSLLLRASMRATTPGSGSGRYWVTQTVPAATTIPKAPPGTPMVAVTRLAAGSTRYTTPLAWPEVTQTAPSPKAMLALSPDTGVGMVAATRLVCGSMRSSAPWLATQVAPKPTSTSVKGRSSRIRAATSGRPGTTGVSTVGTAGCWVRRARKPGGTPAMSTARARPETMVGP